jgi:Ca2+-binding RTX toxin-like protein
VSAAVRRRGVAVLSGLLLGLVVDTPVVPLHAGATAAAATACPAEGVVGTGLVIQGTPGNDTLCGTTGDDVIYGGGGNDVITGGTGDDTIYGDDGNDTVVAGSGSDVVYGGAGDDAINGDYPTWYYDPWSGMHVTKPSPDNAADTIFAGSGKDYPLGEEGDDYIDVGDSLAAAGPALDATSIDMAQGNDGDDVIVGSGPTYGNTFWGGAGNDILYPYPWRLWSNSATGDDGSDVAILVNMTRYLLPDIADLDGSPEIGIGSSCTVVDPLIGGEDVGSVTCAVPWPSQLSGLGSSLDVTVSVDQSGVITWGGDLFDGLASLQVDRWRQLVRGGVTADICVCDPLVPIGQLPPDPDQQLPFDYDG